MKNVGVPWPFVLWPLQSHELCFNAIGQPGDVLAGGPTELLVQIVAKQGDQFVSDPPGYAHQATCWPEFRPRIQDVRVPGHEPQRVIICVLRKRLEDVGEDCGREVEALASTALRSGQTSTKANLRRMAMSSLAMVRSAVFLVPSTIRFGDSRSSCWSPSIGCGRRTLRSASPTSNSEIASPRTRARSARLISSITRTCSCISASLFATIRSPALTSNASPCPVGRGNRPSTKSS